MSKDGKDGIEEEIPAGIPGFFADLGELEESMSERVKAENAKQPAMVAEEKTIIPEVVPDIKVNPGKGKIRKDVDLFE